MAGYEGGISVGGRTVGDKMADKYTAEQLMDAYEKYGRSWRKACLVLKIDRKAQYRILKKAPDAVRARMGKIEHHVVDKPKRGVKRFIFTCAQNDTPVVAPFWRNLVAYSEHLGAELHVVGFAYNPSVVNHKYRKFDDAVLPYLTHVPVNVGDKLTFCAEISITPTAVNPLSGFETYTRDKWGVFPHPRIALQSVPTPFDHAAKQIMTTGAVTHPSYTHSKAGMKAQFHHIAAALLVELDSDGDVFCRHLISDDDGAFYDLTNYVSAGKVRNSAKVEAINWGDIHVEELDPVVDEASWGEGGILDTLKPEFQFFHDILDLGRRGHHNIKDPHFMYRMWAEGTESMVEAFELGKDFLYKAQRKGCTSLVVESNHDDHFARWLRESDFKKDPVNADFYLRATAELYRAYQRREKNFSVFAWAMGGDKYARFLTATQSFKICDSNRRGVECAIHGHDGANGAKGHINSFAKMGSKANVGHTHACAIYEGIYQAGTASKLDLGYNRGGLSSWNHAHIITYKNGKRIILTLQGKKWRAQS